MQYLIVCENIDISGGELLTERIAKKLCLNNSVRICCKSISPEMKEHLNDTSIDIKIIQQWDSNEEFVEGFDQNSEIRILSVFCNYHYRFYNIFPGKTKSLLYVVYPLTGIVGLNSKGVAYSLLKRMMRYCINNDILCKKIAYMDEDCKNKAISYYKLHPNTVEKMQIINISINEITFTSENLKNKSKVKNNKILTVARADFPFKGYILGLIKWFEVHFKDNDSTLVIASYGKDIAKIYETVDMLCEDAKKRIIIIEKVDTKELVQLYKDATIYIGMGTTVVEAAAYGCISIPVAYNTYDIVSQGYFTDNYNLISADKNKKNRFGSVFLSAINMGESERYEITKLGHEYALKYYSITENTKRIENIFEISEYDRFDLVKKMIGYAYKKRKKYKSE